MSATTEEIVKDRLLAAILSHQLCSLTATAPGAGFDGTDTPRKGSEGFNCSTMSAVGSRNATDFVPIRF